MPKTIIAADSQLLNSVQYCARATKYTHELGLSPITIPDYYEKGGLLHDMLKTYYILRMYRNRWAFNKMRRDSNPVSHADVVDICVRVGRHLANKMRLDLDDVEVVIGTFRDYCTHRANDGWDQVIAVEQTGSFILYEDDRYKILYMVKMDLVLQLQNLPVIGVCHKSMSKRVSDVIAPDGSTFNPGQLENQFMGYALALGTNSFIKNDIGFQKTLKPSEKFNRHLLNFSNDNLEEWRQESAWWLIRHHEDSAIGLHPRNLTSCNKFSGCLYRPVCKVDRELRYKKLLTITEKKDVWDVGKLL